MTLHVHKLLKQKQMLLKALKFRIKGENLNQLPYVFVKFSMWYNLQAIMFCMIYVLHSSLIKSLKMKK